MLNFNSLQAIRDEAENLRRSQSSLVDELQARIQQLEADVDAARGQSESYNASRDQALSDLKGAHQVALSKALAAATAEHDQLRTQSKVRSL